MALLDALNITNVLLLVPLMLALMVIPALLGLHPVITATILAITLSDSPLFADDHFFLSLGLLANWMATTLVSPFSGLNLLLAALSRRSPFEISLKHNAGFALMLWIICYAAIVVLYLLK
ncbi:hypothetical protein [Planococcus koreensis]|uniref:hypothetical protein n=1 Tax=Planococcus koreensis TaxID=112331 RepID=UPI0039FD1B4A